MTCNGAFERSDNKVLKNRLALVFVAGLSAFSAASVTAGAYEDWRDATEAMKQKNYDKAITLYTRAIDAGTYSGKELGQLYHMRGKARLQKPGAMIILHTDVAESAISDFTASIKLNPNEADVYNDRGAAFGMMDKPEKSIPDYSAAIQLRPNFFWPYNNRCLAYKKMGRKDDAIKDCKKAIELDPKAWQPQQTLRSLGALP